MTTLAHEVTWYIAREWEDSYTSAVLSGIVGDLAHQRRGGYHISIEDNPSGNYSIIRPDDKAPPGDWSRKHACAIDMSMNPADMKLCSDRLWTVWNDKTDPRRIYINGFNGWFGSGDAKRYDFVTQGISITTSDHKWHVHVEERRRWLSVWISAYAIVSVLKGQTKQQYIDGVSAEGIEVMFCKFGDGEAPQAPNEAVKAMQFQLETIEPGCLGGSVGIDGAYGPKTASALSRLVTGGDAKVYAGIQWGMMQIIFTKKFADTGGTIELPTEITVTGTLSLPASVPVTGALTLDQ